MLFLLWLGIIYLSGGFVLIFAGGVFVMVLYGIVWCASFAVVIACFGGSVAALSLHSRWGGLCICCCAVPWVVLGCVALWVWLFPGVGGFVWYVWGL